MGSLLASCTLDLMLEVTPEAFFGTVPVGSNLQSLVLEIIITFLLMFVVSGVSTDDRAVSHSKTYQHELTSFFFTFYLLPML